MFAFRWEEGVVVASDAFFARMELDEEKHRALCDGSYVMEHRVSRESLAAVMNWLASGCAEALELDDGGEVNDVCLELGIQTHGTYEVHGSEEVPSGFGPASDFLSKKWCFATDLAEFASAMKALADEGNSEAQNVYGLCLRRGFGVWCNYQEASKYFGDAVCQGNKCAIENLRECVPRQSDDPVDVRSVDVVYRNDLVVFVVSAILVVIFCSPFLWWLAVIVKRCELCSFISLITLSWEQNILVTSLIFAFEFGCLFLVAYRKFALVDPMILLLMSGFDTLCVMCFEYFAKFFWEVRGEGLRGIRVALSAGSDILEPLLVISFAFAFNIYVLLWLANNIRPMFRFYQLCRMAFVEFGCVFYLVAYARTTQNSTFRLIAIDQISCCCKLILDIYVAYRTAPRVCETKFIGGLWMTYFCLSSFTIRFVYLGLVSFHDHVLSTTLFIWMAAFKLAWTSMRFFHVEQLIEKPTTSGRGCSICHGMFSEERVCLPCGHVYHTDCILAYLCFFGTRRCLGHCEVEGHTCTGTYKRGVSETNQTISEFPSILLYTTPDDILDYFLSHADAKPITAYLVLRRHFVREWLLPPQNYELLSDDQLQDAYNSLKREIAQLRAILNGTSTLSSISSDSRAPESQAQPKEGIALP